MALDNTVLAVIVDDMREKLIGAFVDKPYSLALGQYALPYHGAKTKENQGRGAIVISCAPEKAFISYSYDRFTKVDENSAFSNILKRISGMRITDIRKVEGEREIEIDLEVVKPEVDTIVYSYTLVVDLFALHPNIILVNKDKGIIVSAYKETHDISSPTFLVRGMDYTSQAPRRKVDLSFISLEEIKPFLSNATFYYFSRLAEKIGFNEALKDLVSSRTLYSTKKGLQVLDFDQSEIIVPIASIYSYHYQDQRKIAQDIKEKKLRDLIEHHLCIAKRKQNNLIKDLQTNKERLKYKEYGQILYLYQTEWDGKKKIVNYDNYIIPIDPDLNYVENANSYFRKYRKAKNAVPILENLIIKTRDDITYLEKKIFDLRHGSSRDILELKTELAKNGYLKDKTLIRQVMKNPKKKYEPHYLLLEHGKIGYGMNDLQNETLTFELAPIHALFFHVKDYPGPHVVLLAGYESKEYQNIAAELAIYLAQRSEGEVFMTEIKNVKKNKAKTGLVNILKFETILIKSISEKNKILFSELK